MGPHGQKVVNAVSRLSRRSAWAVVAALLLGAAAWTAAQQVTLDERLELAPGVWYWTQDFETPRGVARAHIVQADLTQPHVSADLVYPGHVAQALPLSAMAAMQGAVAAVNGDFFNISATQPGVVPTNAPVGPAIAGGVELKAAVPTRQRFGPSLPLGASVEDVIGLGTDGLVRLGRLTLEGHITTPSGTYALGGFNQYALPVDGIGVFDVHWGVAPRKRAVCGNDNRREDPCSTEYFEVRVREGRVAAVSQEPGAGAIAENEVVLVGREAGARILAELGVGDPVQVAYGLVSSVEVPFVFAVGGQPIVRDGKAVLGLDNLTAAIRSAAGAADDGNTLILLALDRNMAGMTYAELARLLLDLGVHDGVNLDGGGSSTLVVRDPGQPTVTVKNMLPTDAQRAIPNGIGIFVDP